MDASARERRRRGEGPVHVLQHKACTARIRRREFSVSMPRDCVVITDTVRRLYVASDRCSCVHVQSERSSSCLVRVQLRSRKECRRKEAIVHAFRQQRLFYPPAHCKKENPTHTSWCIASASCVPRTCDGDCCEREETKGARGAGVPTKTRAYGPADLDATRATFDGGTDELPSPPFNEWNDLAWSSTIERVGYVSTRIPRFVRSNATGFFCEAHPHARLRAFRGASHVWSKRRVQDPFDGVSSRMDWSCRSFPLSTRTDARSIALVDRTHPIHHGTWAWWRLRGTKGPRFECTDRTRSNLAPPCAYVLRTPKDLREFMSSHAAGEPCGEASDPVNTCASRRFDDHRPTWIVHDPPVRHNRGSRGAVPGASQPCFCYAVFAVFVRWGTVGLREDRDRTVDCVASTIDLGTRSHASMATSCSGRALVLHARALPCFARGRTTKMARKVLGGEARGMRRCATRTRCESGPEAAEKKTSEAQKLRRAARKAAGTFAPRSSTPSVRPAARGSLLCTVFEVQAVASVAVGGLLACNVLFPSEGATVARMLGMWSVWMLAVPSLRARECSQDEKEALDYAFLAMPLANVAIPMLWKSFAGVYMADVLLLLGLYAWKGAMPGRMEERTSTEQ